MDISGERILIFGDSLSHPGSDSAPYIQAVTQDSNRVSSAPGDLLASMLLEQGATAAQIDARIGRSAINFWDREDTASLIAADAAFQPTKVIVMLGTNDIGRDLGATQQAMTRIRDTYENMGADVWAIGPMTYVPPADNLNAGAPDVLTVMQSVFGADKTIDAQPLAALEGRTGDGVHFTYAAALPTAQALAQALVSTSSNAATLKRALIIAGIGAAGVAIIAYTFSALKKRQLLGPIGMLLAPKVVGPALMAYDNRRLSSAKDVHSDAASIRARYEAKPNLTEIQKRRPRPLHKLYGPNPTPEQTAISRTEHSRWNSEYRRASKEYKAAVEGMNELLRRTQQ